MQCTQMIIGEALTDHYVKQIVSRMQDHVRNIPEFLIGPSQRNAMRAGFNPTCPMLATKPSNVGPNLVATLE